MALKRTLHIFQGTVYTADIIEGSRLAVEVAGLVEEDHCLVIELKCKLPFARSIVYITDVIEGSGFAIGIIGLMKEAQRLVVELECAPWFT